MALHRRHSFKRFSRVFSTFGFVDDPESFVEKYLGDYATTAMGLQVVFFNKGVNEV